MSQLREPVTVDGKSAGVISTLAEPPMNALALADTVIVYCPVTNNIPATYRPVGADRADTSGTEVASGYQLYATVTEYIPV